MARSSASATSSAVWAIRPSSAAGRTPERSKKFVRVVPGQKASARTEEQVRVDLGAASSLRRIITAQEVADVVVFLCSPRASSITGDAVSVAGGNRGVVHY